MDSGQLSETGTADVLRTLAERAATGCLRIERGALQADIWFRNGAVYTAVAPEARARLGDRLVGGGHITQEQLDETLALQSSMPQPLRIGELLIERGLIDRATLRAYVREQITDSVAATLAWIEGTWRFTPDEETGEDVPLDMSVENLLMEGARRLGQWEVIRATLGSLDTVVDFATTEGQAELALTPDEWSMLTRIDGKTSVAQIAARAGYGQLETARIVYGLMVAGVVRPVTQQQPPATPIAPGVDRNELLREFAGLDGLGGQDDDASRRPSPPPAATPAPTGEASTPEPPSRPRREPLPPPEEPERRKGFLGRFRRG